jgi:hypothetical protein
MLETDILEIKECIILNVHYAGIPLHPFPINLT